METAKIVKSFEEKCDIYKALAKVPIIDMKFDFVTIVKREAELKGFWVEGQAQPESIAPKVEHIPLIPGREATIVVSIERVNKSPSIKFDIANFPKVRDC